jgi:hypothetical protein
MFTVDVNVWVPVPSNIGEEPDTEAVASGVLKCAAPVNKGLPVAGSMLLAASTISPVQLLKLKVLTKTARPVPWPGLAIDSKAWMEVSEKMQPSALTVCKSANAL